MLLKGGPANSGTKFDRRPREQREAWTCPKCKAENKGNWVNCMTQFCRERRPS